MLTTKVRYSDRTYIVFIADDKIELTLSGDVLAKGIWMGSYVKFENEMALDWNLLDLIDHKLRRIVAESEINHAAGF